MTAWDKYDDEIKPKEKIKVGVMFSKFEDVILPREFILKEHIADVEETFV